MILSSQGPTWRTIVTTLSKTISPLPITSLNLSNQNIGVEGAEILANALEMQRMIIRNLYLSNTRLGSAGIIHLASVLRQNVTLHHLDISCNIGPLDGQAYDAARTLSQSLYH